jgi:hypothetical protein
MYTTEIKIIGYIMNKSFKEGTEWQLGTIVGTLLL